jgi:hypothetical protein
MNSPRCCICNPSNNYCGSRFEFQLLYFWQRSRRVRSICVMQVFVFAWFYFVLLECRFVDLIIPLTCNKHDARMLEFERCGQNLEVCSIPRLALFCRILVTACVVKVAFMRFSLTWCVWTLTTTSNTPIFDRRWARGWALHKFVEPLANTNTAATAGAHSGGADGEHEVRAP